MSDSTATIFSQKSYEVSDSIAKEIFGGNFLFRFDKSDGTFPNKVDYFGISLLRYPGGEMTEHHFDVNYPDETYDGLVTETLSEFLAYAQANGITPVIVLPIKKYIHNGTPVEQAAAEVREFVSRVTSGEFGDIKIPIFEIGNEFHLGKIAVSAAQYGEYASAFALAIKDGANYDTQVAVQIGTHWSDKNIAISNNNQIIEAFERAGALDAVDMMVTHLYAVQFDNVEEIFSIMLSKEVSDAWEAATGRSLEVFASEWNVQSFQSQQIEHTYGMAQAATQIEMLSELVKIGVDIGAVWPIQQNTRTELGGTEGTDDIRVAGEVFRMLATDLVGTKVLNVPMDVIADGQVAIHAFDSDSKLVVFLSALDLLDNSRPFNLELVVSNLTSGFSYVWAEKLSTDAENIFWPNVVPTLTTFHPSMLVEADTTKIDVTFDQDYEIIKLVFIKDSIGMTPLNIVGSDIDDTFRAGRGDDMIQSFGGHDVIRSLAGDDRIWAGDGDDVVLGNAGQDIVYGESGDDFLAGGRGDDFLYGGVGDDILRGGKGNDSLFGGEGNDKLAGSTGDDFLFGEAGDDRLWGGEGNDTLDGGSGADKLKGGDGDDTLIGGEGKDRLWGGEGRDTFIFTSNSGKDRIHDFEIGVDVIAFHGENVLDVTQTLVASGLKLSYGDSSIIVTGLTEYFDATAFVFHQDSVF